MKFCHRTLGVVLLAVSLYLLAGRAWALTDLPQEEWARLRAEGGVAAAEANQLRLNELSHGRELTDAEVVAGLTQQYGLPTLKSTPTDPAGSPRLNYDMNGVIDERDLLPLGYRAPQRSTSTVTPFGTVADGNAPKALVVLVKFTDQAPTDKKNAGQSDVNHDTAWAGDRWFDLTAPAALADTSVGYYYQRASYGRLDLTGDVFYNAAICDADGWITSAYTRAEIDGVGGDTKDAYDVVEDAITQLDPYVDFSDYDSNGDGYVDSFITIYAGPVNSYNMWHYYWYGYINMTTDGVRIFDGIWTSEEAYIANWCHEFGHNLGLPDLYDVGGGSSGPSMPGIGYWGMMGSWNSSTGTIPPLPCAFSRLHQRWAEASEVPTALAPLTLTINRATNSSPDGTLYRVWRNGFKGKEYFLLEFRDADHDFDQNLPGDGGLLIWHVDEDRTSANNHDNSFDPQRVWLECADDIGAPVYATNPWYSGYNGADGVDYLADTTTPNALDNAGAVTYVKIDPTSDNTGTSMTVQVKNEAASGLPTLSWDQPADGTVVSGNVTIDVTSTATSRVQYYVDDCLKQIEYGAPYDGFSWDSVTALDGSVELKAVAINSGGGNPVRMIKRTVTVDNGALSGKPLVWSDNFDAYSGDTDNALLGLWNLHEDQMGLDIRIQSTPAAGSSGNSIAFAQASYPIPPANQNNDDTNAGKYEGQDDEWLMSPRLKLSGYSALELKYKVAFKGEVWNGAELITQISADDGASWDTLEILTYYNGAGAFNVGSWTSDVWAQRTVALNDYLGQDVYVRFLYVGGWDYNVALGIDDVEVTGTPFYVSTVAPNRALAGTQITLTGTGFGATQTDGVVRFNDGAGDYLEQSSVVSWNATTIECLIPAGAKSSATDGVWVVKGGLETNHKSLTVILPPPDLTGLGQL